MNTADPAPIPLALARRYAEQIKLWLKPYCERIEIAGSIRRGRPQVGDVDLVIIPRITTRRDLVGACIGHENECWRFVWAFCGQGGATLLAGKEPDATLMNIRLRKCQLDLFFCKPETWATTLLCRTGSKEHNIWFAERAKSMRLHWTPNRGVFPLSGAIGSRRLVLSAEDEIALYRHLGLHYMAPENRELTWINAHSAAIQLPINPTAPQPPSLP